MKISSTQRNFQTPSVTRKAAPSVKEDAPSSPDSLSGILVHRFATQPVPKQNKWGVIAPTVAGAALGAATGLIGEGLGAGAALPGIAIVGLAGATIGSKIDGGKSSKWTAILGGAGAVIGAAGVVAGAVGGVPGAVAGGLSLAGTGFALGHLYQHFQS